MIFLLMLALSASAADCVPRFYKALPRDGDFVYAAAAGSNPSEARQAATAELINRLSVSNKSDSLPSEALLGLEQDDYRECQGVSYAMVRIDRAVATRDIKRYYKMRQGRVDELDPRLHQVEHQAAENAGSIKAVSAHAGGQDLSIQRLDARIESIKIGKSVAGEESFAPAPALSPDAEAGIRGELMPLYNAAMARVTAGSRSPEDMGTVLATYATLGQTSKAKAFCSTMLRDEGRMDLSSALWLNKRCGGI